MWSRCRRASTLRSTATPSDYGLEIHPGKPECGGADRPGHASIFGGNGLLRTLVAARSGGRRGESDRAWAGGWGQARARLSSHTGARQWRWLSGDALVELEGRDRLEQRIGGGIVFGVGGLPPRRAAGRRDACPQSFLGIQSEKVGPLIPAISTAASFDFYGRNGVP